MSSQLRAGGRWRPCLIACAWLTACRFDTSAPETFAVDGGGDAGRAHAAATATPGAAASDDAHVAQGAAAPSTTSHPNAGAAATPAANGGSGGALGTAATPNAGAPASTGHVGVPATAPADDDAGRDAAADPESSIDDTECAFEFSACLLANPLGYADCARMNAEHCDLLGANGMSTPAADGGVQPSAACSLQVADCVMRMPTQAQECMDMLATCTL